MDPIFQAITVLFFGVFQAFGGAWFGAGLRALVERSPKAVGLITSGVAFGGVATFMSGVFLQSINPWLFYIGLGILSLALLAGAFFPRDYLQEIGIGTIIAIGLGGAATAIGILVVARGLENWASLTTEDLVFGALFSGCWTTVGLGFFITGLGALLHGKSLGLRPSRDGSMEIVPMEDLDGEEHTTKRKKRVRKEV